MATAATVKIPSDELSFENQLTKVKMEIGTRFRELIEILKEREKELLRKLEEIETSHKLETDKQKQILSELNLTLKQTQESIKSNILKDIQSGIIKMLKDKQKEIEFELKPQKLISFVFDNTLLDRMNGFGKISVVNSSYSCLPVVDYKGKVKPVVSIGTGGSGEGQFNCPWGVAIDYRTDNIYVADRNNNRVQVFNKDCKFLFLFGADKMKSPLYITIDKERVFVSQSGTGCLLLFDLKGNFIKQIGTRGSGEGQFNDPHGIAINVDNGDIYVCDRANNRIQIFSQDYSYKSQLGIGIVKYPVDIQLTKDTIFVLSHQNPFLYSFNYNLNQVQNTVCDSISKHLNYPNSFKIDGAGNFIISDYNSNNVIILDHTGQLLHKLTNSLSQPVGVHLNLKGGIIIVNYRDARLLLF